MVRRADPVLPVTHFVRSHDILFRIIFFFFKQKTAYEMRISDWSSDVCSSDLFAKLSLLKERADRAFHDLTGVKRSYRGRGIAGEIGRASCRERVCQYV